MRPKRQPPNNAMMAKRGHADIFEGIVVVALYNLAFHENTIPFFF
jgi:hypothetical protein